MKQFLYSIFAVGLLVACNPKNTEAVIEDKAPQEIAAPTNNVELGAQLYASNCVRCHGFKDPKNFTAEEWKEIVPRMAVKAKIDADTENKILEYVLANAK
jgi:cytochrome c5